MILTPNFPAWSTPDSSDHRTLKSYHCNDMEFGTQIFFDLGKDARRVDEVLIRADDLIVSSLERQNIQVVKRSITENFPEPDYRKFPSIEVWCPQMGECRSVILQIESVDARMSYSLQARKIDTGYVNVLALETSSDLWMPFLDIAIRMHEGVLEHALHDYELCKQLFAELDADRCLGSQLMEYYEIDDPYASGAFLFTRNGPQRLARPLEEGRAPRSDGDPEGPSEFQDDPVTGLPGWAWIVDKPFSEIAR